MAAKGPVISPVYSSSLLLVIYTGIATMQTNGCIICALNSCMSDNRGMVDNGGMVDNCGS